MRMHEWCELNNEPYEKKKKHKFNKHWNHCDPDNNSNEEMFEGYCGNCANRRDGDVLPCNYNKTKTGICMGFEEKSNG